MSTKQEGFFGGLKKYIFKQEDTTETTHIQETAAPLPTKEPDNTTPASIPLAVPSNTSSNEQMAQKAYQLIESINQPGVDFFELWNAAEENGGVTGTNIKAAYNALKFADKTLSKEKVLSSGKYYSDALQKALDDDIAKKTQEVNQLLQQKQQTQTELTVSIEDLERKITEMKHLLTEKSEQLKQLDNNFEPKLKALNQTIETGKKTIGEVITKIHQALNIAEKEL